MKIIIVLNAVELRVDTTLIFAVDWILDRFRTEEVMVRIYFCLKAWKEICKKALKEEINATKGPSFN